MHDLIQKIKHWLTSHVVPAETYERNGIRPGRDWGIILSVSLFLFLLSAGFAFYFYSQVDQGNLFAVPTEDVSATVHINTALLTKIVHEASLRATTFSALQHMASSTPDPSL